MRVNELAKSSHMTSDAVRYYTRLGLLHPKRDPINGYRKYSITDNHRLRFIARAKQIGFTLAEIQQVFSDAEKSNSPCPRVRDILQRRIAENRQKIELMTALQLRMEQAQREWTEIPDGMPDGQSICQLIEAINA
ncbi:MAG: MerR family DNA-binding protein [Mariprofundus sp.]|nr:MerR family DNA-binding protein [Mariprofundus sp.]